MKFTEGAKFKTHKEKDPILEKLKSLYKKPLTEGTNKVSKNKLNEYFNPYSNEREPYPVEGNQTEEIDLTGLKIKVYKKGNYFTFDYINGNEYFKDIMSDEFSGIAFNDYQVEDLVTDTMLESMSDEEHERLFKSGEKELIIKSGIAIITFNVSANEYSEPVIEHDDQYWSSEYEITDSEVTNIDIKNLEIEEVDKMNESYVDSPLYVKLFNEAGTDIDTIEFDNEQEANRYCVDVINRGEADTAAIYDSDSRECIGIFEANDLEESINEDSQDQLDLKKLPKELQQVRKILNKNRTKNVISRDGNLYVYLDQEPLEYMLDDAELSDEIWDKLKITPFDIYTQVSLNESINEKWQDDYCDIFGCEEGFFTREEIDELAEDVADRVNNILQTDEYVPSESYLTDNLLEVILVNDDMDEFDSEIKIDMRKIRKPSDINKYIEPLANQIINKIQVFNTMTLDESLFGEYSDKILQIIEDTDDITLVKSIIKQLLRYAREEDIRDMWIERDFEKNYLDEAISGTEVKDIASNILGIISKGDNKEKFETIGTIIDNVPDNLIDDVIDKSKSVVGNHKLSDSEKKEFANKTGVDPEVMGNINTTGEIFDQVGEVFEKDPKFAKSVVTTVLDIVAAVEPTPVGEVVSAIVKVLPDNIVGKLANGIMKVAKGFNPVTGFAGNIFSGVLGESLEGPVEGPEMGLSSMINDAIQDEWKTIDLYNSLSIMARSEGYSDIASVIDDINTEENMHVGQLQQALKTISPNADAIAEGEKESDEQLGVEEE